jgi:hypothetical protein
MKEFIMNCKFIVGIFLILLISCSPAAQKNTAQESTTQQRETSIHRALDKCNISYEQCEELLGYIRNILQYGGVSFKSDYPEEEYVNYLEVFYEYDVNGKYLFVYEMEFSVGGSSNLDTALYIFDVELIREIPWESLFVNVSDNSFQRLVIEYLSSHKDSDGIDFNGTSGVFAGVPEALSNFYFSVFFDRNGVGIKFMRYAIGPGALGNPEIVIPYTKIQPFLTSQGRDVFQRR